ncbi:MAG: endonuclease III domain-containing protein [Elusimicrobiota bacterium]
MIAPRTVYRKLLAAYGPRGWWPVTSPRHRRPKYHPGRYDLPGPRAAFEICAGAIMTQNTAWSNVVTALELLRTEKVLEPRRILRLRDARLRRLIRSTGYFVQKAKKLKYFSRYALARRASLSRRLRETPLPALREELLGIYGVGPETADSMLLYAGGRRSFVVDAYTKRIGMRLGWFTSGAGYHDIQDFLTARMPRSVKVYQELHALFVELGKRACRTRPCCGSCPVRSGCPERRRRMR